MENCEIPLLGSQREPDIALDMVSTFATSWQKVTSPDFMAVLLERLPGQFARRVPNQNLCHFSNPTHGPFLVPLKGLYAMIANTQSGFRTFV